MISYGKRFVSICDGNLYKVFKNGFESDLLHRYQKMTTLLSVNYSESYDDVVVNDTNVVRVMYFAGQKKAKRDSWITPGSILIEKDGIVWVYVGLVMFVHEVESIDGVARFLLVVEKNNHTGTTGYTKKLLMEKIGWILTDEAPGIAHVTHV